MKRIALAAGLALLVMIGGCASVEPWQREHLARRDMSLASSPGMDHALEKTYTAKEAASGVGTVGGGGCGCN